MRTAADYIESVNDGRRNYLDGALVENAAKHPQLATAVQHIASGFTTLNGRPEGSEPVYLLPRSVEDLRRRAEAIDGLDFTLLTTSQSLLALQTARSELVLSNAQYGERIDNYINHARANSIRISECITDAKGRRLLSPSEQDDPDLYVRVVERKADGVVIRGAKLHVTSAGLVDDLMIMPTKRMKPGEEQYAISCVVPVNAPGVTIINATYAPRVTDDRAFPVSSRHSLPEGMVVFDDVFVPNERVFLDGDVSRSGTIAHSLGLWERYGGVGEMALHADVLVGLAQLIAEANGIQRAPHIKEKIGEMAIYATLLRAGYEAAVANSVTTDEGLVHPSELYTNAAKYYGAAQYHLMVRHLHDISGGILVTAPSVADLEHPEIGAYVEKYLRTGPDIGAALRLRLVHTIRDLTADALGGWHLVTNLFSGGGMLAQRMVTTKHYDMQRARELALHEAGLSTD